MTLGERIQKERTARGLSQEALGERVGVSRQAVSKWEANKATPDLYNFFEVAKVLQTPADEFLIWKGQRVEVKPMENYERNTKGQTEDLTAKERRLLIVVGVSLFGLVVWILGLSMQVQSLRTQIDGVTAELKTRDISQGWISYFSFDMVPSIDGTQYVGLSVDLLPTRLTDDLNVEFALKVMDQEAKTVSGQREEGGHYTALLDLRDLDGKTFTVSALFTRGEEQYIKPLVQIEDWGSGRSYTHTAF